MSTKYWDYISSFWNYLSDKDRDLFENFWDGLNVSGDYLKGCADRFINTTNPETSATDIVDNYYEIVVGPSYSTPMQLDPTQTGKNFLIRPKSVQIVVPSLGDTLYRDLIHISADDYYKIRSIGLNCYVVIKAANAAIEDKYFKIDSIISSEEPQARNAYIDIDGSNDQTGEVGTFIKVRIQCKGPVDASRYQVHILDAGAADSALEWSYGKVLIKIKTADAGTRLEEFSNAINNVSGTAWGDIINKFNDIGGTLTVPIFSVSMMFNEFGTYKPTQTGSDRYIQSSSHVWKWYLGSDADPDYLDYIGDPAYGEYVTPQTAHSYMIRVQGDLTYIKDEQFLFYITTGLCYDVKNHVKSLPSLQANIDAEAPEFTDGIDYVFYNNYVEFKNQPASNGTTLYCREAEIIEWILYDMYGTLVDIPDWDKYNYNNESGKTAVNGLLKAMQNISNLKEYERALNIYYGLPVAPEDGTVLGLYESYDYVVQEVSNINSLYSVKFELPAGRTLHSFINKGSWFIVNGGGEGRVSSVVGLTVSILMPAGSSIQVGDLLNLKLVNRFRISDVSTVSNKIYVYNYNYKDADPSYSWDANEDRCSSMYNTIVTNVKKISNNTKYPEMIVYGTKISGVNIDGVYHIVGAGQTSLDKKIWFQVHIASTVGNSTYYDNKLYHDFLNASFIGSRFIGGTFSQILPSPGYVHIPYPTHKYLYMLGASGKKYKLYLDAPIDTRYDKGDILKKYDIISNNVSALNGKKFPNWSEYGHFKRFNSTHVQSNILESVSTMPGASFGKYFPDSYL